MGLLVMVTAVYMKDVFLTAVEREIHPKPHQIVQEVRALGLGLGILDTAARAVSSANNKKIS